MHIDPLVMRMSRNEAQSPTSKPKPSVYQIWADSLRAEDKLRTHGRELKQWQEWENLMNPPRAHLHITKQLSMSCSPWIVPVFHMQDIQYLLVGLTNIYVRWI